MPLCVNGVPMEESPSDTRTFFHTFPQFKESSSTLGAMPPKVIGPVGLLYVSQREYAVTVPHDKNVSMLGTDDATTCHMVAIRHSGSGAVALGHFDGCSPDEASMHMTQRVQELSMGYPDGRLELHVVGGFADLRGVSEELAISVLHAFHKQPVDIDLVVCCLGEFNTTIRGGISCPIIYGLGVHTKTGEIFPATFPEKGPNLALRCARHFTGGQQVPMLDIYDCNLGLLRIGPFNYEPLRGVDLWLQQSDDFILQHLSTSPEVEPPHFAMQVRATLKHIQEHPFPSVTIFPDNRPHFYRKDEMTGAWLQIRY